MSKNKLSDLLISDIQINPEDVIIFRNTGEQRNRKTLKSVLDLIISHAESNGCKVEYIISESENIETIKITKI